jgi:hypothetical protein
MKKCNDDLEKNISNDPKGAPSSIQGIKREYAWLLVQARMPAANTFARPICHHS